MLIRQDDVTGPGAHRILCLGADAGQSLTQGTGAAAEGTVDLNAGGVEMGLKFRELGVADKRGVQNKDFRL